MRNPRSIGIELGTLTTLSRAVKAIRMFSPNTANVISFRNGIAGMCPHELLLLARAIDEASIAVNHLDRQLVLVRPDDPV